MLDLVIVGAGPAGMAAAVYAARAELSFVVLEKGISGGQILSTSEIDNYPGIAMTSGMELARQFREHCDSFQVNFQEDRVIDFVASEEGNFYTLQLESGKSLETRTILIATGANPSKLGVDGEEQLTGAGVSYCATCDGAFFKNREVAVIGGGNTAVEDAIFLARICKKVTLIHRRDSLRAAKNLTTKLFSLENVSVIWNSVVTAIEGRDMVEGLALLNRETKETSTLPVKGVFIAVGTNPNNLDWQEKIACNDHGYFIAGEDCATKTKGVYAAGDVRTKELRQVITAAADGANAVYAIEKFLNEQTI